MLGDPALSGANFQLAYSYKDRKASVEEWDASTKTWSRSGLIYSTPLDQRLWPVLVTTDSTTFAVPNYDFADSESSGTIRVFVRLGTTQEYDQPPTPADMTRAFPFLGRRGQEWSALGSRPASP